MRFLAVVVAAMLMVGTAQAQEIPPREFIVPCVSWVWDPGVTTTEIITGYEVWIFSDNSEGGQDWWWIGETFAETDLSFSVCNREYNRIFRVAVRSVYESGGTGPFSDSSEPYTHRHTRDFTENGMVGFADFGAFGQRWGGCNDLREITPCE